MYSRVVFTIEYLLSKGDAAIIPKSTKGSVYISFVDAPSFVIKLRM